MLSTIADGIYISGIEGNGYNMSKIFIAISMLLLVSACDDGSGRSMSLSRIFTPTPWGLGKTPDGSPKFQQGWEDGCESGLGSYGNTWYQAEYDFKQDPNLIHDNEYYIAWKDGHSYCRWYVYNWARTR